jgi:hypothetical protein
MANTIVTALKCAVLTNGEETQYSGAPNERYQRTVDFREFTDHALVTIRRAQGVYMVLATDEEISGC